MLACATSPVQMLSTPVRQLDSFTFASTASACLSYAKRRTRRHGLACSAISKSAERNLFGLIRCTTTYEVYKTPSALYRRYLPAPRSHAACTSTATCVAALCQQAGRMSKSTARGRNGRFFVAEIWRERGFHATKLYDKRRISASPNKKTPCMTPCTALFSSQPCLQIASEFGLGQPGNTWPHGEYMTVMLAGVRRGANRRDE